MLRIGELVNMATSGQRRGCLSVAILTRYSPSHSFSRQECGEPKTKTKTIQVTHTVTQTEDIPVTVVVTEHKTDVETSALFVHLSTDPSHDYL